MLNRKNKKPHIKPLKVSGFTLVEMAIVLVVLGVIVSTAQTFYRDTIKTSEFVKIESQLKSINQALISFALQNKRLPCADTDGNGYEGTGTSNCGLAASNQTGAVPYKTLGMNQMSTTQTNMRKRNIVFGVYRNARANLLDDADLAVNAERTGDVAGSQYFLNNFDMIKALSNAKNAAVNNNFVYTTGIGVNEDCNTNTANNFAYILASAGIEDMDNNGNVFDGVNASLSLTGTGTRCFSSTLKRKNNQYDDVVLVMNFQSLIGRLNTIN
ncbi:MAG: prepilin-type N-terminal cleavage/methylation domain-containing protein [Proteobacteria bacterium]|nr:prepilin-type N-terminal cleavage/methylation domain-containing protein [Pseudomonadota bacterium]